LAKPRGRPPRTGKQEEIDAPLVQEAVDAWRDGKFRSPRAAAVEFSGRLPGGVEANLGRLYKKILARKDERGAETSDDDSEDGIIQLAVELAGESPEIKVKRLTRIFRILVENSRVVEEVIVNLRRDGITLPADLLKYLMKINLYIIMNEREMAGYEKKIRDRKPKKTKVVVVSGCAKQTD
jgi:hypothetical protein